MRKFKALKAVRWVTLHNRFIHRVISAGLWAFSLRGFDRLLSFAKTIVLARLLVPADFGLFGIALVTVSAAESLSQTGFRQALIQKKGDIASYLNTTWTVQMLRGFTLTLLLWGLAPYISAFFKEPQSIGILRGVAIALFLNGVANPGLVAFEKDLRFSKIFAYRISGTLVDTAAAISIAVVLKSVWALPAGYLAGGVTRVLVSYLIHPFRPRLHWDKGQAAELFRFGKWITGAYMVTWLNLYGDDLFIGKFLGTYFLGLYQVAFRIAGLAATEIRTVISQVAFPAYSKVQTDIGKLRTGYYATLEMTASLALPLGVGTIWTAPLLVHSLLGAAWNHTIPIMQLLAAGGLLRAVVGTGGALYQSVGKPQIAFGLNLVRLVGWASLIYPLSQQLGLLGASVAVVGGMLLTVPIWLVAVARIFAEGALAPLRSLWGPIMATLAMSIAAALLVRFCPLRGGAQLSIMVPVMGIVYLGVLFAIRGKRWKKLLAES